jgi:phosphohistidine phosphatase
LVSGEALVEIYLVRHGVAQLRRPDRRDEDRTLTRDGRKKTVRAFRGLRKLGVARLDRILSSPLVRAWETAKILSDEIDADGPRVEGSLAPGGEPASLLARIAREAGDEKIALVGHQPDLGRFATWLTAGSGRGLELGKAGVARIDIDGTVAPGRGELVWLLPPRALRRI